ncbi:unnamed protein product [Arabis nemorensis]|uniref:Uncharacterized protein n=1 Tax=Arabis nemorensis TaxID=586526 RepID=A0A565AV75_9BRAS|nr:unnamed protein product [Arabis nemorensis]
MVPQKQVRRICAKTQEIRRIRRIRWLRWLRRHRRAQRQPPPPVSEVENSCLVRCRRGGGCGETVIKGNSDLVVNGG